MSVSASASGTPRSSEVSHNNDAPASPTPTWAPPRSPLPPHRLAKLANALGVSTPLPAMHRIPSPSPSFASSPTMSTDTFRGSPSPSMASSTNFSSFAPSTSRYLLHVIPPLKLPHNLPSDDDQLESTMSPPTASGYHTQFRRGVFVPVHATLQSQLGAIAKEYALPSTTGMILYLCSANPRSRTTSPSYPLPEETDETEEPGPRLSEDIWRHLWVRVLKAEQSEESLTLPSRTLTPSSLGLGKLNRASRSTPGLLQEATSRGPKPLLSVYGPGPEPLTPASSQFAYPSPSTPSSASISRSDSKTTHSSSSVSNFDADTPDTSVAESERANSFDLPGLNSPSLIPILAKVEFDIDRKKATWFDPWVRSRKMNYQKRQEGRKTSAWTSDGGKEGDAPLKLKLPAKASARARASWLPKEELADSPVEETLPEAARAVLRDEGDSSGSEYDDDATTRVASSQQSEEHDSVRMSPSRKNRKQAPPPLVLHDANGSGKGTVLAIPSPSPRSSSHPATSLPYLKGVTPEDLQGREAAEFQEDEEDDMESDVVRRSPVESGKRTGGVFDDLDLGLDPSLDYDESDPYDRRRSQYIMQKELDVIEKNLAQFSPRALETDLEQEQQQPSLVVPGETPPLPSSVMNSNVFPQTPTDQMHSDGNDQDETTSETAETTEKPAWPAVPYSSLKEGSRESPNPNAPPSPPRLALNGATTGAPKSFNPGNTDGEISAETQKRQRELEQEVSYPAMTPMAKSADSPVIPLSPDPFGRFSSSPSPVPGSSRSSSTYWEKGTESSTTTAPSVRESVTDSKASRFSNDSIQENVQRQSNRTTVMSVKGIRKLWRRSNKASVSNPGLAPPPTPTQATMSKFPQPPPSQAPPAARGSRSPSMSGPIPPNFVNGAMPPPRRPSPSQQMQQPQRPGRPSEETLDLPDIPSQLAAPPPMANHRPSMSPIIPSKMLPARSNSHLDQFRFDQESPYPMPISRKPTPPSRHHSNTPSVSQQPPNPVPESHRSSVRKSILKWKAAASGHSQATMEQQQSLGHQQTPSISLSSTPSPSSPNMPSRPIDRPPSAQSVRPRRPSVLNAGPRSSNSTPSTPDIPPSPRIPEQFLKLNASTSVPGPGSHLSKPSVDSFHSKSSSRSIARSNSPASSRYSEDTRPSIDSSQFEMVSPKIGSLTYPYNSLEDK